MAMLVMEKGPEVGRTFPLDAEEVTIGRGADSDIVLELSTISRQHARIRREGDTYILEDRQSTNGTYLNRRPVTESALREGDRIRLGQAVLRFSEAVVEAPEPSVELVATDRARDTAAVLERVKVEQHRLLMEETPLGPARVEERLALVSQVSAELLQLLDPEELAERVADRLLEMFPKAAQALVALAEGGETALTPQAVRRRGGQGAREVVLSQTILRLVTEEREAVLCADVRGDVRFRDRPSVVGARIRSFLCVPLVCRDEFLGLIYLDNHQPDARFRREDLVLATAIAGPVALAAGNIRLHRSAVARARLDLDLSRANEIQRRCLPTGTPDMPGMSFETYYAPAFEVGGDFYDFVRVDEDRWLVAIGDVSGKGISAALIMMQLMRDIRYHAASKGPGRVLAELSQSMARQFDGRIFASLLCLEIHPRARRAVLATAGHCPPLICPRAGEPYFFSEVEGSLLGIMPEEPHNEATLTLGAGDCVLAYTDGLTEAMNSAGVIFGEERLLDAAEEAVTQGPLDNPQQFVERVLEAMRTFSGYGPPTDDLTMVAFQVAKGSGSPGRNR